MIRRLGGLIVLALLAQACGGSSDPHTGVSGTQVVVPLRGITARQDLPAGCSGSALATGPGPSQTIALPPLEFQLSLAAGQWTVQVTLVCNGETATGAAKFVVVPPTPASVTVQIQAHGSINVFVSGGGSVTSSPSGISCPGDCAEIFTIGTHVTLTANPSSGFQFGGYQGGGCGANPVCTVTTTTAPISVAATFTTVSAPTPPPAPPPLPSPPPPTTGTLVVTNTSVSACCTIPDVTFSGPGPITPTGAIPAPGGSVTRTGITPGSYLAFWCGSFSGTPFTITAAATTNLGLLGTNCG